MSSAPLGPLILAFSLASATAARAEEPPYRFFARSPQELPLPSEAPALDEAEPAAWKLCAAPGEFEPLALCLYAARPIKGLRVTPGELAGPAGAALPKDRVRVQRVLPARRKLEGGKREALVPAWVVPPERAGESLAAGQTASFLLTFHVPAGTAPGVYKGAAVVEAEGLAPRQAAIELTVRSFPLSPTKVVFAMLFTYEFRYLERYDPAFEPAEKRRDPKDRPVFLARGEAVVRDLAEHGMTAIFPHSSRDLLRKEGRPYLPDLEQSLKTARACGMDAAPGFFVGHLVNAQYKDVPRFEAKRDCALLEELARHAAGLAKAAGYSRIHLLPSDEPDDPDGRKLPVASQLLKAGGGIEGVDLAVTSGANHTDVLRKLADLHRVSIFAGGTKPEEWAELKRSGHEVWLYDNITTTGWSPAWSRFVFGFFGWRAGFDGFVPWTYPLYTFAPYAPERPRVDAEGRPVPEFDAEGRPINTLVWEAIREGADDRRYLETLEGALAAARAQGKQAAAAAAAQALLDELRAALSPSYTDYGYEHNERGEPSPGRFGPRWLDEARERVAAAIVRLRE